MKFIETHLRDAYLVDLDEIADERGFFARAWCKRELADRGLVAEVAQANLSYNKRCGTLRGLHYQAAPHEEVKYVRCLKGAIYDVIVDLRPGSQTYLQWLGVELTGETRRMLCAPEGFAHGFQTLADDTEVFYFVSQFYAPEAERGIRYDDPRFAIAWPLAVAEISPKDASWPDFAPA